MELSRRRAIQSLLLATGVSLVSVRTAVGAIAATDTNHRTLKTGSRGKDVEELQNLLTNLTFQPSPSDKTHDGNFGALTRYAVVSFQIFAGLKPDGIVGPKTWIAILSSSAPKVPGRGDNYVHIDRSRRLMTEVQGGLVALTTVISCGSNKKYYNQGQSQLADTPAGHYRTYRYEDERYTSSAELGSMPWATFFDAKQGLAVHDGVVPLGNVSHGCVRVPRGLARGFQKRAQDVTGGRDIIVV